MTSRTTAVVATQAQLTHGEWVVWEKSGAVSMHSQLVGCARSHTPNQGCAPLPAHGSGCCIPGCPSPVCCVWGMQLARVKAGLTGMAKAQFDVLRATHHLDHLNPTTTTTTCSSPAHAAASSTFATPSSYTHSSVSAAAQRAMESNQVSNFNRSSHL